MDELQNYSVKTDVFEGPLDTLLAMIEKRKLLVNDISLSKVADDYIDYVKSLSDFPLADSAQFVLIASTLVLIKSKSLLPTLDLTSEEEQDINDLENRLKSYQKFKELSKNIAESFGRNTMYVRQKVQPVQVVFAPTAQTEKSYLLHIIKKVIDQIPKVENIPKTVVNKILSLEEAIETLTERITSALKISFRDFSKSHNMKTNREEKITLIVHFLAMLELVKQGIINVRQDNAFHDIEMETSSVGVPHY